MTTVTARGPAQFRIAVTAPPGPEQTERLFTRAGDATVEVLPGGAEAWVAFDREAPSLLDAVVSAVRDLDNVGLVPVRVAEDDDLVSIGVVAERTGRSAAGLWDRVTGPTGGGFPPPVGEAARPLYRWSAVLPWLAAHEDYRPPPTVTALHMVNLALRIRTLRPTVDRPGAVCALLCGGVARP